MKEFAKVEQALGGDGGKVKGAVGIEKNAEGKPDLVAEVKVSYPFEKVAEPALKVIDNVIDKIEQWIPGDQKAMATQLKEDARKDLMQLVADQATKV